jgi:hypothetical protein
VSTAISFPADTSLHGKRLELIAMSNQLREAHSQILATAKLLKRESEELSQESRVLRGNGHRLRSIRDAVIARVEMTINF